MDFMERMFDFAPDGGSGSLEFLLFAIPVIGIAYLVVCRRQRPKKKSSGHRGRSDWACRTKEPSSCSRSMMAAMRSSRNLMGAACAQGSA